MKRINPIVLLIALNVVLILLRDLILPDGAWEAMAVSVQSVLLSLGPFGYAGIVAAYAICGFFFVPLLIPLNILGGALYGAYAGTAVALAGITLGSVASTISARYVFTGMQKAVDKRPGIRNLIDRADNHRNLAIIMMRFAIVIPYLWQNIALAVTRSSTARIAILTAISAIPGAAIYSFLGAGLVQAEDMTELLVYVSVPVVLLLGLTGAMVLLRHRLGGTKAAGESGEE